MQLLKRPLAEIIWDQKYDAVRGPRGWGIRFVRFIHALIVEFTESQFNLRAMSLVYMTMLSLVPLLAVSFSVLKGFGVHYRMEPLLSNFFSPLGPKGAEVVNRIMEFISNVQVGVLGTVGLAILLYISIDIISTVEGAFNTIWKAGSSRTLARRFSDYLAVIIIAPILVSGALALTASLKSTKFIQYLVFIEPIGSIYFVAAKLSPYLLVCVTFTFVYKFLPNTKVNIKAAIVGGLIAGIIWQTLGWSFTSFIVGSVRYKTIYAGFSILIFFMLWVYFNWLLILIGVAVSFLWQHPPTAASILVRRLPALHFTERVTFSLMYLIGKNFSDQGGPTSLRDINMQLNAPPGMVQQQLDLLKNNGLIIMSDEKTESYVPGKAPDTIKLSEIALAARGDITQKQKLKDTSNIAGVDRILVTIEDAIVTSFGERTLSDLLSEDVTDTSRSEEHEEDEQKV